MVILEKRLNAELSGWKSVQMCWWKYWR